MKRMALLIGLMFFMASCTGQKIVPIETGELAITAENVRDAESDPIVYSLAPFTVEVGESFTTGAHVVLHSSTSPVKPGEQITTGRVTIAYDPHQLQLEMNEDHTPSITVANHSGISLTNIYSIEPGEIGVEFELDKNNYPGNGGALFFLFNVGWTALHPGTTTLTTHLVDFTF